MNESEEAFHKITGLLKMWKAKGNDRGPDYLIQQKC